MVCGCTILRASIPSSCWWSVISHRPTEWRIFPLEKLLSPLKQRVCLRREAFCKYLEFWEDYNTACLPCWCHVGTVPMFWDCQSCGITVDNFSLWATILLLVLWPAAGEPDLSRVGAWSAAQSAGWAAWGSLFKAGGIHCYAVLWSLGMC